MRTPPRSTSLLREWRRAARLSQRELSRQTGISLRTLQRIERLEVDNPPIRYLANCAIVLGCELEDLIEPAWRKWKSFDDRAQQPPAGGSA